MADTSVQVCEECGASVYPEHIQSQRAGTWGGKLYCIHCYGRHKQTQVTIDPDDFGAAAKPEVPLSQPVVEEPAEPPPPLDEPLSMEPESRPPQQPAAPETESEEIDFTSFSATPKIRAFAGTTPAQQAHSDERKYKRHLNRDGKGSVRVRIFHAKLNDGALRFMEDQINEWIDSHPDMEIKHASTQVGVVEGKSAEPHLIMTVWY